MARRPHGMVLLKRQSATSPRARSDPGAPLRRSAFSVLPPSAPMRPRPVAVLGGIPGRELPFDPTAFLRHCCGGERPLVIDAPRRRGPPRATRCADGTAGTKSAPRKHPARGNAAYVSRWDEERGPSPTKLLQRSRPDWDLWRPRGPQPFTMLGVTRAAASYSCGRVSVCIEASRVEMVKFDSGNPPGCSSPLLRGLCADAGRSVSLETPTLPHDGFRATTHSAEAQRSPRTPTTQRRGDPPEGGSPL